jgi:drug/metabolite transporter (DMT)-like permease
VLGVFLAALSAACFAFNNASTRRGVLTGTVLQAMAITVPMGVPIFFAIALASGNVHTIANFPLDAVQMLAMVGVVHFIAGRYCNYRAVKAIGANLSGPVIQLGVLVTLALAVLLLGEAMTPLRVVGILLVILGPAMMRQAEVPERASAAAEDGTAQDSKDQVSKAQDSQTNADKALPVFQPQYAEGYLFGLLAAVCYGVSPIMLRSVVEHQGIGGSLGAGVISYAAATVLIVLFTLLWPGQLRHVLSMDHRSARWFTVSGFFVCISQTFFYMAVAVAPVSVVMPLMQLQLVFRYGFARSFNPDHEVFGGKAILGTLASLAGAVALSLSTDFVLSLADWPDWLAYLLRLHWVWRI